MKNIIRLVGGTVLIILLVVITIPLSTWNHPERMVLVCQVYSSPFAVLYAIGAVLIVYILVWSVWNILKGK